MLEIEEMETDEIHDLIASSNYAHLGCSRDDEPYVVPINYAFVDPHIYIYTTEGKKADILKANPRVCLQIEAVKDRTDWRSAIVHATANEVRDSDERERAVRAILKINPTLTPAISVHWMDDWVRENIEILFRLDVTSKTGRRTAKSRSKFYAKFKKSPDKTKG